jgi:hypothetical protein
MRRFSRPSPHGRASETVRAGPAPAGVEFLVLQFDGSAFRAAHVQRRDRRVESLGLEHGELAGCLEFLGSRRGVEACRPLRVVLVTPEAELDLPCSSGRDADGPGSAERIPDRHLCADRHGLVARMRHEDRERWSRELLEHGLELASIYPLAGSPLGILDVQERPAPCLQVEHAFLAVMEIVGGRCAQLELHHVEPTLPRVLELVGPACPELFLCGGGADLSALGYAIARAGTTWVRILRPDSRTLDDPAHGAMVGAARHACELAPAERLSFVPSPRMA